MCNFIENNDKVIIIHISEKYGVGGSEWKNYAFEIIICVRSIM